MTDDIGAFFMEIGHADHLTEEDAQKSADMFNLAIAQYPRLRALSISIGGYDDDPRELHQIAEVAYFVRRFAQLTGLNDSTRAATLFLANDMRRECGGESAIVLLQLCGAFTQGPMFKVNSDMRGTYE